MSISYSKDVKQTIKYSGIEVPSFIDKKESNLHEDTVDSFGEEWLKFNHFDEKEIIKIGNDYFDIVPPHLLNQNKTLALDVGCGTGRWTKYISKRVKHVECIDPSQAVFVASKFLSSERNVRVSHAGVDNIPFKDETFDLVFSLGVLHHIPNTFDGIKKCVEKVNKGGHFLVYLYYNLDNRGIGFKILFTLSNALRYVIAKLPRSIKHAVCDILAVIIYLPFILLTRLIKKVTSKSSVLYKRVPLSYYHDKSFQIARNDSLDRFGTPLEKRFSRSEINQMLIDAGLSNIKFSNNPPFWHAIGQKL